MRAYCIYLPGHAYSERVAARCLRSAWIVGGIKVTPVAGVGKDTAEAVMAERGLRWTWGGGGAGLRHHDYGGCLQSRIGCAMSHFLLWERCVALGEPILVLEHDAVFLREFPQFEWTDICQINDPAGATRRGQWWSDQMRLRGTTGVHRKTWVTTDRSVPDGLAGNSAYVLKPGAAARLMAAYEELGVWPNDATMCQQLFPTLEEYYPFVTRVEQERSTTLG